jgi:hypothetical protein
MRMSPRPATASSISLLASYHRHVVFLAPTNTPIPTRRQPQTPAPTPSLLNRHPVLRKDQLLPACFAMALLPLSTTVARAPVISSRHPTCLHICIHCFTGLPFPRRVAIRSLLPALTSFNNPMPARHPSSALQIPNQQGLHQSRKGLSPTLHVLLDCLQKLIWQPHRDNNLLSHAVIHYKSDYSSRQL